MVKIVSVILFKLSQQKGECGVGLSSIPMQKSDRCLEGEQSGGGEATDGLDTGGKFSLAHLRRSLAKGGPHFEMSRTRNEAGTRSQKWGSYSGTGPWMTKVRIQLRRRLKEVWLN